MDKETMNNAMMDLANAVHQLGMAIYLIGESIEEDNTHGYQDYIIMAKESISNAEGRFHEL